MNRFSERFIKALYCLISIGISVNGDVQFQYDSEQCLDQSVEYQCTVTGSGFYGLTWSVYTDSGTQITGSPHNYLSSNIGTSVSIGGVFTVEQLSQSPLISNISFTVQSCINGYTIICQDGNTLKSRNFTINIKGIPSSPDNVTIHTDTFTNSSVNISWTESSSPCVTGYRYTISSSALEENIIMESTSNSVMVERLVPSDNQYCVVVTAIDTANRNSSGSDPVCFIFNVPPSVSVVTVTHSIESSNSVVVIVNWEHVQHMSCSGDVTVPDLSGYKVIIVSNSSNYDNQSGLLSPGTSYYTFTGVPVGGVYTVTITTTNGIGSSIPFNRSVDLTILPSSSVQTTSFSIIESYVITTTEYITITSNLFHSTTKPVEPNYSRPTVSIETEGLSSSVSAGISVAITVPVTVVITAIITVIILYLYHQRRVNKQSSNKATPPQVYETPISTNEVQMKGNKAYGQVQYTTDTVNKPALYEELNM